MHCSKVLIGLRVHAVSIVLIVGLDRIIPLSSKPTEPVDCSGKRE